MSRIGNLPVFIPSGVSVTVDANNLVKVTGPLGELEQKVNSEIKVEVHDDQVHLKRSSEQKEQKAMHGLYRALINDMIVGVSKGYEIQQELVGIGYRAEAKGQRLELSIGYSHNIVLEMPPTVKVKTVTERRANPVITLRSADKQLLGHIAAKIRSLRPPEPYKGKGIKFVGEKLRKKAGKTAASV